MDVHVEFGTGRGQVLSSGMTICEISVPELSTRQYLYLPFDHFHRYFGPPEGLAADLLVVAGSCYVIDRLVPRAAFADRWTRELAVNLPVADPGRWSDIGLELAETLTFLTGDRWHVSFHQRHTPIYQHRHRRLRRKRVLPAASVCLFSGGLDSLIGAVDLLSETQGPVTLVGHYDLGSNAKAVQTKLADELASWFPRRCNLVQARVGPVPVGSASGGGRQLRASETKENTLRSRSLVFLALGLYVAQQHSRKTTVPLLMPENGFIALNPPLTDSRLGSCSTRTAHPLFLERLQQIAGQLGIENPIVNPLASKTKGDALACSRNLDLVRQLASDTVSCAHPTRRQGWIRRSATHCGYCVPCIYRRAALHHIGMDQGDMYGIDVCSSEISIHEDIAADLRAVLNIIYSAKVGDYRPMVMANQMPLPEDFAPIASRVLKAGIDELTQLFQEKAVPQLQEWAGIE